MDHHITGLNNPDAYTVCLGVCFVSLPTKTNQVWLQSDLNFNSFLVMGFHCKEP